MTLQPSGKDVKVDDCGRVETQHPVSRNIARLAIRSPWPLILLEVLSGEQIYALETWIYPFKHIIVYEKQIRKCVELLNETKVEGIEPKDLTHILSRIFSEVVRILGPKREDFEWSDTYVFNILQKKASLNNHFAKVEETSPKDQEEELKDDTKADNNLFSISTVDDPTTKVSAPTDGTLKENLVLKKNSHVCTCLKDARDHLQLLVDTIDSHLGSLLTLHKAIRGRVTPKISFENLWHLFQPGDIVVTSRQPRQAYRVIHVSGGRPLLITEIKGDGKDTEATPTLLRQSQASPFSIDCVRFDFDGDKFGPVQDRIYIQQYEEERTITELDLYPIECVDKKEKVSETLLDRGRRFAGYHNFQHKRYEGLSLSEPQEEVSTSSRSPV